MKSTKSGKLTLSLWASFTIRAAETGPVGRSIEDSTEHPADTIFDKTLTIERIVAACKMRDRDCLGFANDGMDYFELEILFNMGETT